MEISIHALLAESDFIFLLPLVLISLFLSTLSLRRATLILIIRQHSKPFLSTLSLRRATSELVINIRKIVDFYPRSPCGERLLRIHGKAPFNNFYPRSPCGERLNGICLIVHISGFLSTLSLRRATTHHFPALHDIFISIHALLAESDYVSYS